MRTLITSLTNSRQWFDESEGHIQRHFSTMHTEQGTRISVVQGPTVGLYPVRGHL